MELFQTKVETDLVEMSPKQINIDTNKKLAKLAKSSAAGSKAPSPSGLNTNLNEKYRLYEEEEQSPVKVNIIGGESKIIGS